MGRCPLPVRAAALTGLLVAAPLHAAEVTERFCGYAWDLDDGRYRYTEVHEQVLREDRWLRGTITYVAPDGATIGRKELSFDANPFIPNYRLELFDGAYVEGIDAVGSDGVKAFRKEEAEASPRRERIGYTAPAAADSGFHALIRARLPELLEGKTQRFDFVVAGALDRFWFRVRRAGDTSFEGRPAVKLVGEPDSILSWVVDGLELTYDPATGRLLRYKGPTNLREPRTGDGYDVRIVFASRIPPEAPAAAVAACGA